MHFTMGRRRARSRTHGRSFPRVATARVGLPVQAKRMFRVCGVALQVLHD